MEKIIRGVHKFQDEIFAEQKALFERLSEGQSPETLFITCSDSRIDPSLLTQTAPGELFVLRNAGNIIPPWGASDGGEAATIEYAVRVLGVHDIIVCGHTHCGAMQALIEPASVSGLPSVRDWLSHAEATASIIRENYGDEHRDTLLTDTIKENVLVQIENLRTHPCVAARIAKESLYLHGWIYRFETGDVFAFNPDENRFTAVASVAANKESGQEIPTI